MLYIFDLRRTGGLLMVKSSNIKVSVIIPAYDAAGYIETAISSAQAQSLQDIEIIVVDDASRDATAQIVERMASTDKRVRLFSQSRNQGPSAARNLGIDHAAGDWIALLDADDRYASQRLERLLHLGETTASDMVADNILLCGADQSANHGPMIPVSMLSQPRPLTLVEFLDCNEGGRAYGVKEVPRFSYGYLKPMVRRSFLDRAGLRYDERNRYSEDFMFAVRCFKENAKWWLTGDAFYLYTMRSDSATFVQTPEDLGRIVEFDRSMLRDPALSVNTATKQAIERHLRSVRRRYHYRRFANAVKAHHFMAARRMIFENSSSLGDILWFGAGQMPTIIAKAIRGGYSSRGNHS